MLNRKNLDDHIHSLVLQSSQSMLWFLDLGLLLKTESWTLGLVEVNLAMPEI